MKQLIFIVLISLHLCSCQNTEGSVESEPDNNTKQQVGKVTKAQLNAAESMLVNSRDYQGLAELYKGQLRHKDTAETRLKLAQNYLDMSDPESAIFYLKPLVEKSSKDATVYYILAKAFYEQQNSEQAITYAKKAVILKRNYGDAFNLLGISYASIMDLKAARHYFEQARITYFNDIKIKNNLAMLDIMEGDYDQALIRLSSLYKLKPKDPVIKTNLLLVLAKKDNFRAFSSLLRNDFASAVILRLYGDFKDFEIKAIPKEAEETEASPYLKLKQQEDLVNHRADVSSKVKE